MRMPSLREVRERVLTPVAIMIALLGSASAVSAGGDIDPAVRGEAIVRVTSAAQLAATIAAIEHRFGPSENLGSIESRHIHLIGFDPAPSDTDETITAFLDGLRLQGLVIWAEQNYLGRASEGRTDSLWLSGMTNGPQAFDTQYAFQRIGTPAAHARSTGTGVLVAVLDTGVDATHPLLAGRIAAGGWNAVLENTDTTDGRDGIDQDGDGRIDEMAGHGTFVAGLIRGTAPDAWILPVTVLDDDGIGDAFDVGQGFFHAIDRGAHVINASFGSTYQSAIVEDAVDEAETRGIVVVAAAGNEAVEDPRQFPACSSAAYGVAAVRPDDIRADFTNVNDKLALAAPGVTVNPRTNQRMVSALPNGDWGTWEGTSFATSLVSGAVAIVRSQRPDWVRDTLPGDLPDLLFSALEVTAVPLDDLNPDVEGMLGAGRLDLAAAAAAAPPAGPVADLNGDGRVNGADFGLLLEGWGPCPGGHPADFDFDARVGGSDLGVLFLEWTG
jgi:serine protease